MLYRVNIINKTTRLVDGTIWMDAESVQMYNSDEKSLFMVEKICTEEEWKRAEREKAKRAKEERKCKKEKIDDFWKNL